MKIITTRKLFKLIIFLIIGIMVLILSGCSKPTVLVSGLKILIDDEGIYRIDVDTLEKNGIVVDGTHLKRLRLSHRGEPLPLFVFQGDGNSWIEFYGQESESQYSVENIYILELLSHENEQTILITDVDGYIPSPNVSVSLEYFQTDWYEENLLYFPQVQGSDNWYWFTVIGGQSEAVPIKLTEVMPGEGYIRLNLWSNTDALPDPDHHLILNVNNQTVIDRTWEGKGERLFTASIPQGTLMKGENQISIDIPGDTQAAAEVYWINWLEITYPRRAVAQRGQLKFVANDKPLLLSDFSGQVQVFDITEENHVFAQGYTTTSDGVLIYTGLDGHVYYAIGESGFNVPLSITPINNLPDLRANGDSGNYIAIGPEEFLASAEELFSLRETQGLSVVQAPLQAIYDQYNYGFPEPEAIQRYISDAMKTWAIVPQYVLLVGDASYDPKNYLGQSVTNILPSFFIQTTYGGQTVSDLLYTDYDNDGIPDAALGRIPATTTKDVEIAVRKIVAYENTFNAREGEKHILAIADGQDVAFRIDARHFLEIFPSDDDLVLYTPAAGITDANEEIQSYFDEGYTYIAYFGHGSVVMWGKDRLFTVEDAAALTNSEFPVLINMTCLTGLFTHPTTESLSEAFLFNPEGGAVAIFAPTSLTLSGEQARLSAPLAEVLGDGNFERIGDAFLFAQRTMAVDSPGVKDVLETFLLLGDPGLIINQ